MDGLERMEYCWYDSAGIAELANGDFGAITVGG